MTEGHWFTPSLLVYDIAAYDVSLYPTNLDWNWFEALEESIDKKVAALSAYASQAVTGPHPINSMKEQAPGDGDARQSPGRSRTRWCAGSDRHRRVPHQRTNGHRGPGQAQHGQPAARRSTARRSRRCRLTLSGAPAGPAALLRLLVQGREGRPVRPEDLGPVRPQGYQRRVTMRGQWATLPLVKGPATTRSATSPTRARAPLDADPAPRPLPQATLLGPLRAADLREVLSIRTDLLWEFNFRLILLVRELLGIQTP